MEARFVLQAAGAEAERGDQRAMHEKVGIAPDGRSEMRVARKPEPEMAAQVRRIDRLRLGAQHQLVRQRRERRAREPRQQGVELFRALQFAEGNRMPQIAQQAPHRLDPRRVRPVMDPPHADLPLGFQRLGRRDIRRDHELLDDPVGREPLARSHCNGVPAGVEHHPALGQVQLQRPPPLPGAFQRAEGPFQMGEVRGRVRPVQHVLKGAVSKPGRRPHPAAPEAVAAQRACRPDL